MRAAGIALLLLLVAGVGDWLAQPSSTPAPQTIESTQGATLAGLDRFPVDEQRAILATMAEIARDGPFAYRQDGTVFQDREGLLPAEPRGFYHEYTVPTPGDAGRGRRRIVLGTGGQVYYTDDHYLSFYRLH